MPVLGGIIAMAALTGCTGTASHSQGGSPASPNSGSPTTQAALLAEANQVLQESNQGVGTVKATKILAENNAWVATDANSPGQSGHAIFRIADGKLALYSDGTGVDVAGMAGDGVPADILAGVLGRTPQDVKKEYADLLKSVLPISGKGVTAKFAQIPDGIFGVGLVVSCDTTVTDLTACKEIVNSSIKENYFLPRDFTINYSTR